MSEGLITIAYGPEKYIRMAPGKARFRKNGTDRDPVLIHSNVDAQNGATYNREVCRLEFENYWLGPLYVEVALTIRFWASVMERTKRFFIRMPERLRERGLVRYFASLFHKELVDLHRAVLRKPR